MVPLTSFTVCGDIQVVRMSEEAEAEAAVIMEAYPTQGRLRTAEAKEEVMPQAVLVATVTTTDKAVGAATLAGVTDEQGFC